MPIDVGALTNVFDTGWKPEKQNSGVSAEVESALRSYGAGFGHIAGALGSDTARDWALEQDQKAAAAGERSGWPQSYSDVNSLGSAAKYVGHLGIQALPYLGEAAGAVITGGSSAIAGAAGRAGLRALGREATEQAVKGAGRTAAVVAGSVPSSTGQLLRAQQEESGTYNLPVAGAEAIPFAALNAFGLEGAVARGLPTSSAATVLRRAGVGAAKGAAGQVVAQGGQGALEEGARMSVNPDASPLSADAMGRMGERVVGGVVIGGLTGGVGAVARGRKGGIDVGREKPVADPSTPTNLIRPEEGVDTSYVDLAHERPPAPEANMADFYRLNEPSPFEAENKPSLASGDPWTPNDPYAGMRGDAIPPAGVQADLFREPSAPATEAPQAQGDPGQAPVADPRQGDLLAANPTAAVATDFSLRDMRQRILAATGSHWGDAPQEKRAAGPFEFQVALRVSRLLGEGKPDQAAAFLASENEKLQTANLSPKTIDVRQGVLDATQRAVEDYAQRAEDARRQELAQAAETGKQKAKPGVVVDTTQPVDNEASARAVREQAAAAAEAERAAPKPVEEAAPERPAPSNAPDDIEAVVAHEAQQRVTKERGDILQRVLDDPETRNPVGRFRSELKKAGFKTLALTEEEAARIERHEQLSSAFNAEIHSGPNEMDVASLVPERRTEQPPAPKKAGALQQERAAALDEADQVRSKVGGAKAARIIDMAMRAFANNDLDVEGLRSVTELVSRRKLGLAEMMVKPLADRLERAPAPDRPLIRPAEAAIAAAQREPVVSEEPKEKALRRRAKPAETVKPEVKPAAETVKPAERQEAAPAVKPEGKPEKTASRPTITAGEGPVDRLQRLADERNAAIARGDKAGEAAATKAIAEEAIRLRDNAGEERPAERAAVKEAQVEAAEPLSAEDEVKQRIHSAYRAAEINGDKATFLRRLLREDGPEAAQRQLDEYLRTRTGRSVGETLPKARTADPGVEGMSADAVSAAIAQRARGWRNAPDIRVVQSEAELPTRVRDNAAGAGGLYHEGKMWLVADNLRSPEDAVSALFHEGLGHHGLAQQFGDKLLGVMHQIYRTNSKVREAADAFIRANPDAYPGKDRAGHAAEEVLAGMLETGRVPGGLLDRIKGTIMQFARRMGLHDAAYSDAEVRAILRKAVGAVTDPPTPGGGKPAASDPVVKTYTRKIGDPASPRGVGGLLANQPDMITDLIGKGRRVKLASMFMEHLNDHYGDKLPALTGYTKSLFRMGARVNEMTTAADQTVKKWDGLANPAERKDVGALMLDSTVRQVRPDRDAGHESNARGTDKDHVALSARYQALSPEAREVYREVMNGFEDKYQQMNDLARRAVADSSLSDADKAAMTGEINQLFQRNKVYFPLSRFGDHIVISRTAAYDAAQQRAEAARVALDKVAGEKEPDAAKVREARKVLAEAVAEQKRLGLDEGGYSVQAFESEGQARRAAVELQRNGFNVTQRLAHEHLQGVDVVPSGFMTKLNEVLDAEAGGEGGPKAEIAKNLKSLMGQLYLQSLPENSALKRGISRKTIAGYSEDARRVFAKAAERDAHLIARLELAEDGRTALSEMQRQAKEVDQVIQDKDASQPKTYQEVAEEVMKRHAASLKITNQPIQTKLAHLAYIWYLGFTPSFAVTNMAQTPLVTMPMMAARHGWRKSSGALLQAAKEVGAAQARAWKEDGRFGEVKVEHLTSDPAEQAALRELEASGIIDLTQEHDLGTIASGESEKVRQFMRYASYFPHYSEKFNRLTTALAGYRMALEEKQRNPNMRMDPVEYAGKLVSDSHFNYSAANAPRFMMPGAFPLSKIMFQFKKYQLAMGYALVNNFTKSIRAVDPQERALARRTFYGMLVTHGLAAGTMGLPGAAVVMAAANAAHSLFGDPDQPWDAQAAYRGFLTDLMGGLTDDPEMQKTWGAVLAHGAFRAPGIKDAIPADVSSRLGLQDIFSPLKTRSTSSGLSRDTWNQYLAGLFGPIGSVGGDVAEAVKQFNAGEWQKGMELMTPKVLRDVSKGARFNSEGVTTSKGNTIIGSDGISTSEIVAQMLGFTPPNISESYEQRAAIQDAKAEINNRRGFLLKQYAEAAIAGDKDEMTSAREAIQAFNRVRAGSSEPIINGSAMFRAVQERRTFERQLTNGVRLRPRERALSRYGDFASVPN